MERISICLHNCLPVSLVSFFHHEPSHLLHLEQGFPLSLYLQYMDLENSFPILYVPFFIHPLASFCNLDTCAIYCDYDMPIIIYGVSFLMLMVNSCVKDAVYWSVN